MSSTLSYGGKLPGHLAGELATIHWADGELRELVPGTGDAPPIETAIFQSGQILDGGYEIRGVLGSGGMGQVFEARDLGLNRLVAIKVAWSHIGAEPLRREAQVLAAFRHPGLAMVHALGRHQGSEFMVMERLTGSTLAELLAARRGQSLPVVECLELLESICDSLAPLHASGLAHADLKPANIMVAPGGRIVLLDFGIARIEQLRVGSKRISGSPHYMAPEAIRGAVPVGASHLVDLYALGIIAFVLATGAPPFDHPSPIELMLQHLHETTPRLAARRPDVPAPLDELVGQLLAKDASERPADIDVTRSELRRIRQRL
jgi:eukaryotic-like serine/threonine-protein kinase